MNPTKRQKLKKRIIKNCKTTDKNLILIETSGPIECAAVQAAFCVLSRRQKIMPTTWENGIRGTQRILIQEIFNFFSLHGHLDLYSILEELWPSIKQHIKEFLPPEQDETDLFISIYTRLSRSSFKHTYFIRVCKAYNIIFTVYQYKTKYIIFAYERPSKAKGQLCYPDGFELYSLNGVHVPKWLFTTKANKLKASDIFTIRNAEQRREFVRKIGTERLMKQLGGKVADQQGNYQLLLLQLNDGYRRPFLRMKNPSINTWHIEPVHPSCWTVQDALNYRRFGNNFKQIKENWKPQKTT